ncbi:MAG: 1-acyl-sn-glycerol-3-phosphate acyltransferase [Bacteroidota bacterium]|jgi:putative hemolysin
MEEKLIDIEKLFNSKNPKLLKFLPRPILRYLKKIIHQDDVNQFINSCKGMDSFEFSEAVIKKFNIKIEVKGLENIPQTGGYIFCSNHPLGGMDAMAIASVMQPIRRDLKFIVNDLLLHLVNLKEIFVGVNKHGKTAAESLKSVDELFGSDNAIVIFPAGLVSRKQQGKIMDLEWKKTFITRAKKYKKDIVPIYIKGENTNFFYNLSKIRTSIGIKANLEMLYLVDEMYQQKDKTFLIVFGKPISIDNFTKDKTDAEWANHMKHKVYELAHQR